jgi:hypothetical protein
MIRNYFDVDEAYSVFRESSKAGDRLVQMAYDHARTTGSRIYCSDNPAARTIGFCDSSAEYRWEVSLTQLKESGATPQIYELLKTAGGRHELANRITEDTIHELFQVEEPPPTRRERLAQEYDDLWFADGFDEAILGVSRRAGSDPLVAYDYDACIEILMERDTMSRSEATEFFEYNVIGAYYGERTPVFVERFGDE